MITYLNRKAHNQAEKEDIDKITRAVENIRINFLQQLETHKADLSKEVESYKTALNSSLEQQKTLLARRNSIDSLRRQEVIKKTEEYMSAVFDYLHTGIDPTDIDLTTKEGLNQWFTSTSKMSAKIYSKYIGFYLVTCDMSRIKIQVMDLQKTLDKIQGEVGEVYKTSMIDIMSGRNLNRQLHIDMVNNSPLIDMVYKSVYSILHDINKYLTEDLESYKS
ncbi:hypothetical protein DC3_43480 [Deinococcus cellulosilyticus NBRC 106333 = KACC 11606]|uniref:Uncharacterized protein n=1 Tax=Deinococcus cellulosilyticus (strain DSM 18568 / NBRC 106333 / KACC 11606 / 5516J-15) TaxID=1223518 RepID=A0A511N787_DEIC1|nr:hypothetical protein DC3_43480 [Deinococcus cellulosilyticus NBRC 106333 = KACC 11606]